MSQAPITEDGDPGVLVRAVSAAIRLGRREGEIFTLRSAIMATACPDARADLRKLLVERTAEIARRHGSGDPSLRWEVWSDEDRHFIEHDEVVEFEGSDGVETDFTQLPDSQAALRRAFPSMVNEDRLRRDN